MKGLYTRDSVCYARWYELRHRILLKIRTLGHIPPKNATKEVSPFKR